MKQYYPWVKEFMGDKLAVMGLLIILLLIITSIFAPYIAPHPDLVYDINFASRLEPPSVQYFFGTDQMGGDILSRIIFGARLTILISGTAICVAFLIGVPLGLIAGYYESWFGKIIMRIAEVFLSLPKLILALAVATALGGSLRNAIIVISITYWPWWTRIAYAETQKLKRSNFIEAIDALGASSMRIIFLHIFPNILSALIIRTTVGLGGAIMISAMLGFLGLGAQPPTPEWGLMIAQARNYLPGAWWFATFPGLAIFLVVFAFNLLGDGLRDTLDPKMRVSSK